MNLLKLHSIHVDHAQLLRHTTCLQMYILITLSIIIARIEKKRE